MTPQQLQEFVSQKLDELWKDEELQIAIEYYGEWNGEMLDKAYQEVKAKIINKI